MNKTSQAEHEQATIRAFILPDRQERFSGFLTKPKTRKKFTGSLAHFRWFDPRFASPVLWKVDPTLKLHQRHIQGITNILHLLKSRGAGKTCWVISEDSEADGQELDLESAIQRVVGSDMGTILSCVPGKLALFAGEDEMLLLAR